MNQSKYSCASSVNAVKGDIVQLLFALSRLPVQVAHVHLLPPIEDNAPTFSHLPVDYWSISQQHRIG